jgi:hypothetical protein
LLVEGSYSENSSFLSSCEDCTNDITQQTLSETKQFIYSTLHIRSYAPDHGPSSETTKVLVVLDTPQTGSSFDVTFTPNHKKYYCIFENISIEAKVLTQAFQSSSLLK